MGKYSIQFKTVSELSKISNLRNTQLELLNVNEIINVNGGPWRKATPKGSGSLPTPHSGYAATIISWDIVTSLAKEVTFLVALVSLSVCLFVCLWTTLLKKL